MPATDYQRTPAHHSSAFASFGRSLRRDAPTMPPPPRSGEDLDAFQRHLAALLLELRGGGGEGEELEFLSVAWIRRLLDAFLVCQEEFRAVLPAPHAERLAAEFGERAVKALDVCNAAREGVDQVRRWERLAAVAASSVLLAPLPGAGGIHEGQLRRARKALSDLSALLVDHAATGGGLASSHRNRSFGRPARVSPSRAASSHSRSLSWGVSRTWSAARQLQAISAGLTAPRAHEAAAYAMGCLLHLAAWALVAAVPCQHDRGAALQAPHHHLPAAPPRAAAFPWAPPLLALQDRLAEEGKRKDRRSSPGLLTEIHALEKSARKLAEAIDAAPVPLTGHDREAEVREAATELTAVCAAVRDGLQRLERQVREVFHRIVRNRMEGLDSPTINGD